jgi:hypothetical protein
MLLVIYRIDLIEQEKKLEKLMVRSLKEQKEEHRKILILLILLGDQY